MPKTWLAAFLLLASFSLVLSQAIPAAPVDPHLKAFEQFKAKHKRKYEKIEQEQYRYNIFVQNKLKIQAHNQNKANTYLKELGKFADHTDQEFGALYLTLLTATREPDEPVKASPTKLARSEKYIDWVELGGVTKVKDQGKCGSCYTFSAAGALESGILLKYGYKVDLSEQELVDCSQSYGNRGCHGGVMTHAFKYMMDNGIRTEAVYPYRVAKEDCLKKKEGPVYKIVNYQSISDCKRLEQLIFDRPYSVSVDATNWTHYKTGVFHHCGNKSNHGVLLVGYSKNNFWKIKNSWGDDWGEDGYIRITPDNSCNVCHSASYPIPL